MVAPKRKYQQAWEDLKAKGKIAIAAPRPLHARIEKAIMKEKYQDVGFSFLLSENSQTAKLYFKVEASKITIILRKSVGVGDL